MEQIFVHMFNWIVHNKEWLLSGIGIALFSTIIAICLKAKQRKESLAPSIVVSSPHFGPQHDTVSFYVNNFHRDNIAQNFHAQLYFKNNKIGEVTVAVIGFTHSDPVFAYGPQITYDINTEQHYQNRDKLKLKYSYFDRTNKIKFKKVLHC